MDIKLVQLTLRKYHVPERFAFYCREYTTAWQRLKVSFILDKSFGVTMKIVTEIV